MQKPVKIYVHCNRVVSLYGLEMFLEFDWVGGRRVVGVSGFQRKPLAVNMTHTWNKTIACVLW